MPSFQFNVTGICQQLTQPMLYDCKTLAQEAKSLMLPFQIITLGVPTVLLIWKVIYCVASRQCFKNPDYVQVQEINPSFHELQRKKISYLKIGDNCLLTTASMILGLTAGVAITLVSAYMNNNTCNQIVNKTVSICIDGLNTTVEAIFGEISFDSI